MPLRKNSPGGFGAGRVTRGLPFAPSKGKKHFLRADPILYSCASRNAASGGDAAERIGVFLIGIFYEKR
jgi:hypothetical protein